MLVPRLYHACTTHTVQGRYKGSACYPREPNLVLSADGSSSQGCTRATHDRTNAARAPLLGADEATNDLFGPTSQRVAPCRDTLRRGALSLHRRRLNCAAVAAVGAQGKADWRVRAARAAQGQPPPCRRLRRSARGARRRPRAVRHRAERSCAAAGIAKSESRVEADSNETTRAALRPAIPMPRACAR